MKLNYLIIICAILLIFSCNKEKKSTVNTIDKSRLKDKVYLDSVKKTVSNAEDFEKLLQEIGSKDFINEIDKYNTSEKNKSKKVKPYNDDLMQISNKLRDTVEQGVEKVIELATGEKVKISELDFGKNMPEERRETIPSENTVKNTTGKKANKNQLENGLKNLKNQFGLEEESMLVELLRSDSHNEMYNPENTIKTQQLIKKLQNADNNKANDLLTNHLKITPKELEFLKKLPNSSNIRTEKKALEMPKSGLPKEVINYLKNNKASPQFIKLTNQYKYKARDNRNSFLSKAKIAKAKFKKLNPTWYSSKQSEEVYLDSRNNMVYLPLGKLSFADKVISHKLGNPKGKYASGSLGEPNVAGVTISYNIVDGTLCHVGLNGVLTVQFTDNVLVDVNGPDLYVFEIGEIEPTKLEISKDGEKWINIGKIEGGTAFVDIHDFVKPSETFNYVRLTDLNTPSKVPGADVDAIATIGGVLRLSLDSEVLFDVGKFTLKKEGIVAVRKLAKQIKSLHNGLITIEGHTDDTGRSESNQILSQKRAHSVSNELKQLIKSPEFKWKEVGYGESRPIVKNDSEKNRKLNRRVEILVMPTMN